MTSIFGKARPHAVNPSRGARALPALTVRLVALFYGVALSAGCQREAARVHYASPAQSWDPAASSSPVNAAPPSYVGLASYYSNSLAGNRTASGDRYEPHELTAAHRFLPFGTIVRVTRMDTNEQVVVVVNDRGPFGDEDRIIDLSRAAAERLHMLRRGVVRVRVDVLGRESPL